MATVATLKELPATTYYAVAIGDKFEIVKETPSDYVLNIHGDLLAFSKKPDEDGKSIHTWFDVS